MVSAQAVVFPVDFYVAFCVAVADAVVNDDDALNGRCLV